MRLSKNIIIIALCVFILAACENKNEPVQIQEKKTVKNDRLEITKEETKRKQHAKPKDLCGFWVSSESFLMIGCGGSPYTMHEYIKNESDRVIGKFMVSEPKNNKFHALFVSGERDTVGKNFTLVLNKEKVELYITMDGEEPKTYKATEVTPEAYMFN